jgi:hypothetical protein
MISKLSRVAGAGLSRRSSSQEPMDQDHRPSAAPSRTILFMVRLPLHGLESESRKCAIHRMFLERPAGIEPAT